MSEPKVILFLCTGNYYRSRYAEALFNARASAAGLRGFIATSRGLQVGRHELVGPVSVYTREAAARHHVPLEERAPMKLAADDLKKAHRVIALKEAEHRSMLDESFPGWSDRVEFWHVHDIDVALPEIALVEIERHIDALIGELKPQA